MTLIFDGSLAVFNVPDEILVALIDVILSPDPTKLEAVTIPVYVAFPLSLIVTPTPTWKLPVGRVVPIPTFDVVEIFPAETYHPSTAIA